MCVQTCMHVFFVCVYARVCMYVYYMSMQMHVHVYVRMCVCARDETILQYIDILQHLLQQYNTIRLKGNINILCIVIYCDILQCLLS